MIIRCMVAAVNSNGESDFYFVKVECTNEQYELGEHYDTVAKKAEDEGYEPKLVFDENEYAGQAILDHFSWDTAETIDLSNER